jgi:glycosyltransferase involved in cell wall biosynthesis/SAM-dependent methyltransferase
VKPEKIAFFTPLPPAQTGTADYAAALIAELKQLVDLHVFERVPARFRPDEFDATVYQIGNNPFHAGIYEAALQHPGIVVLHEANLHDLIRGLNYSRPEVYLREIAYEIFGQESFPAVSNTVMGQQPRTFSMLRRLLDRSRACIVHSRFAEGAVRMKGFRGRVARIPHGADVRSVDGAPFRARLGIEADQPLVGIFGYLRPDKRVFECLEVFRALLERVPRARLLVAGQPHPELPLGERIAELGLTGRVHCLGAQPLDDVDGYIAACDVILNLRWPTFGESSGIAARALGLGRTVVVTDAGASRELPRDVCVRIPADVYQDRVLLETLEWLVSDRRITDEIGASAARWVADTCTWAHTARQYADFLTSFSEPAGADPKSTAIGRLDPENLRAYLARWVEPDTESSAYFDEHINRLVRTLQLTPPDTGDGRILEMGCYLQITPALRNVLGYGEVRGSYLGSPGRDLRVAEARDGECFECVIDTFDAEKDVFPYPKDHFDTVLCCELIEHLQRDPMWMMSEIHRVLKPGGVLLLTTPNIASLRSVCCVLRGQHPGFYTAYPNPSHDLADNPKHAREYTPAEISQLLTAAGFIPDHIETGSYGDALLPEAQWAVNLLTSLKQPMELRGDCIYALGRKGTLPRDFRPSWLYDK